jgi:hypothetical protein
LVLQPQLESQNHIIKPLWLPGSQTQLAILSADAVKIYDLGKDVISPIYYFLLPSGKVRDATFVCQVRGTAFSLTIYLCYWDDGEHCIAVVLDF